jgi:LysM repeat protein
VNSLKTLLGATLLAALAYGVYVGITKKPGESSKSTLAGPKVDLGKPGNADDAEGAAPPFSPGVAANEAQWEAETQDAPAADYAAEETPPPVVADLAANPPQDPVLSSEAPAADPVASTSANAATTPVSLFQEQMAIVQPLLDANKLAEAHLELSKLYGRPELSPEENQQLVELLSKLAGTVVYSRQHLLEPAYTTVAGDTLEQIATSCNVPWQLLAKINGLSGPGPLPPGQELKVIRGPFKAYVDLDDNLLVLFLNGERYAGRFPVAFGKENMPVEGLFTVQNKLENPTYLSVDNRTVPPEDPQNPLGTRKIELSQRLSIHGTNDPSSLNRDDSRGCIRLNPRDVEDVYDILTIGSEIAIYR